MEELKKKAWWNYIDEDLRQLLQTSYHLKTEVKDWKDTMHDYSFIVFPAAKAFEGFLKNLFLDLGFIDERKFLGKRFRIGKALNPSLDEKYRKSQSVYDKLHTYYNGPDLADQLWNTWVQSRNLLFHWFPNEKNVITAGQAEERLKLIIDSMDASFSRCEMDLVKSKISNA